MFFFFLAILPYPPSSMSALVLRDDPWWDETVAWLTINRPVSTSRQYSTYQRQFLDFCKMHMREALPAAPPTVVRFMRDLVAKGRARSTVTNVALSAVADLHRAAGYPSPTVHPLVRQAVKYTRAPHHTCPEAGLATDVEAYSRHDVPSRSGIA